MAADGSVKEPASGAFDVTVRPGESMQVTGACRWLKGIYDKIYQLI